MITLKECIAIALSLGNVEPQIPSGSSKLETIQTIQTCNESNAQGFLNQRTQLDIKINYMLANVEVAYWNLFAAYHNLYAQEEGLRQTFQAFLFTGTRVAVGSETPCNQDQSRAQFERFRRMVIDARGQVGESERQPVACLA